MRVLATTALLAMVALAGCSGGGDDGEKLRLADGTTVTLGEGTTDTLGAIAGYVVDEAIRPLAGAILSLADGRNTTTDESGFFLLAELEPGFYAISASAEGHLPVQASTDVVAGETATVKVLLPRDVRPQPFQQTYPYSAYITEWATIGQFAVEIVADAYLEDSSLCDCSYTFTPPANVSSLIFEAFWEPVAPDPAGLAEYYWEVGGADGSDWYETGYCFSPCRVDVPLDDYTQGEAVVVRFTGPDFWVSYQQRIDLFTTAFHNGPAPEGWSIEGP